MKLFAKYVKSQENTAKIETELVDTLKPVEKILFSLDRIDSITKDVKGYYLSILEVMQAEGVAWEDKTLFLQEVVFNGNGERDGDSYPMKESGKPVGYDKVKRNEKKDYSNEQQHMGLMISRFVAYVGKYYSDYGVDHVAPVPTGTDKGSKGEGEKKESKKKESKNGTVISKKTAFAFIARLLKDEEDDNLIEAFNDLAEHFKVDTI